MQILRKAMLLVRIFGCKPKIVTRVGAWARRRLRELGRKGRGSGVWVEFLQQDHEQVDLGFQDWACSGQSTLNISPGQCAWANI